MPQETARVARAADRRAVPAPVALTQRQQNHLFREGDVLVLFGELFGRGYANGLVDAARAAGMDIIGMTTGRRDEGKRLRALNAEELATAQAQLGGRIINIPLMAGFDQDAPEGQPTPTDLLANVTLKSWQEDKLDWDQIAQCRAAGVARFKASVALVMAELETMIPAGRNVFFAHTMAGGIPRIKAFLAIANRIYKGRGERFMSSRALLESDLGALILQNFDEVTANSFAYLIEGSAALRARIEAGGGQVRYTAYGYHGTEVLIDDHYAWQTYTNYTQGYAKMLLERIAVDAWEQGIKATVFNCPEIRTNSSDIFAGVELPLIPLLRALKKENGGPWADAQWATCEALLTEGQTLEAIVQKIDAFHAHPAIRPFHTFAAWPMDNSPELADLMIGASDEIVGLHKDRHALITDYLSALVIEATGALIFAEASAPSGPVLWLNHDVVAQVLNERHA